MNPILRLLLLLVTLTHLKVLASEVVTVNDQRLIALTPYLQILHDENNSYTPKMLSSRKLALKFQPVTASLTKPGPDSRYWVRLKISADKTLKQTTNWVLHLNQRPRFRTIEYYESQPRGNFRQVMTGSDFSFHSRDIDSATFAFQVTLRPRESKVLYLKLAPEDVRLAIPLSLRSEQSFQQFDRTNWMGSAAFNGIVMLMLVSAGVLYAKSKSEDSVFYLLFTLLFALSMSTIDGSLAWLISKGFPNILFVPGEVYIVIAMAAHVAFISVLLEINRRNPTASKLQTPVYLLACISALLLATIGREDLVLGLFILTLVASWLYLVILSIIAMRRQLVGAGYLVVALTLLAIGSVISALSYYSVFESGSQLIHSADKITGIIHLYLLLHVMYLKDEASTQRLNQQAVERQVADAVAKIKQEHSRFDPLTGLFSRQVSFDIANQIIEQAKRYNTPTSVMIVSIDNFKKINTAFGHTIGDASICHIARLCHDMIRASDVVGRLGADEVVIVLPNTTKDGAEILAERIRIAAEELGTSDDYSNIRMTVSVGVSELIQDDLTIEDVVNRADTALLIAANYGHNRVALA
jgi:diguanylate cyclase (GGDEF)-like protein